MLIYLCLFLLFTGGIALVTMPHPFFEILTNPMVGTLKLWVVSLEAFAVPFCLFLLNFGKNPMIRILTLFWGGWLTVLSLWLVLRINTLLPRLNFYGGLFLVTVLIVSVAITFFSAIKLLALLPTKIETPQDPEVKA